MSALRPDIQALRGVAVLLVVMYHADLSWVAHGYLGVDVFFVISGYLISRQIIVAIESERFSFAQFYYRRAMRLLPATYLVLALCMLVSPVFLLDSELLDFTEQAIGALTFSANFILLGQSGYFETDSIHKPLLHFWSLSLEEQYYLLIPLVLVLLRQWHLILAIALTIASYVAYLSLVENYPNGVFYMLPTRLWELGMGTILAVMMLRKTPPVESSLSAPVSLVAASGVCLIPIIWQYTGLPVHFAMLIICACTVLIIACRASFLNQGVIISQLSRMGAISYSVYLIHWPIFAYLHNANIQEGLWWPYRLTAIVVSIAAGALIFVLVEQRFRIVREQTQIDLRKVLLLLIVPLVLIAVLLAQSSRLHLSPDINRLAGVTGLAKDCATVEAVFGGVCQSGPNPSVLVWGDSYAQHLVPGLYQQGHGVQLIQATRSTCAPVPGITLNSAPRFPLSAARACNEFNRQVLQKVLDQPEITTVVLSALWPYLLRNETWQFSDQQAVSLHRTAEQLGHQLQVTIEQLQRAGKKVLVVAPPPSPSFNAGKCVLKMRQGVVGFGANPACMFQAKNIPEQTAFLTLLEDQLNAPVYRFEKHLCEDNHCVSQLNDILIYRDGGHLSQEGSALLGEIDNWPTQFQRLAR